LSVEGTTQITNKVNQHWLRIAGLLRNGTQ